MFSLWFPGEKQNKINNKSISIEIRRIESKTLRRFCGSCFLLTHSSWELRSFPLFFPLLFVPLPHRETEAQGPVHIRSTPTGPDFNVAPWMQAPGTLCGPSPIPISMFNIPIQGLYGMHKARPSRGRVLHRGGTKNTVNLSPCKYLFYLIVVRGMTLFEIRVQ